jgi:poly-gamma-glutamate capsule biosynthesis protein CapA/YwtB (metallophosphatase superfamily)
MKKLNIIFLVILLLISFTACKNQENIKPGKSVEIPKGSGGGTPVEIEEEEKKISIIATGDIMFHMPQIKSAYKGSKTYDFKPFFDMVKPDIEAADIAIANLETTINPKKAIASYPKFNSPVEVLDAIKYTGFDVLVTANNHCVDTGKDGIISTVNAVKSYGMNPVGTGKSTDDKSFVVEKNGIKVGVLAYTSSTNGIKAPEGMVNFVDINRIKVDIEKIKPSSDFIIVYVHTGTEYVTKVEENQRKIFRQIADLGADAVLGSHPHVVRPSEVYNSKGKNVFIAYSMGNFISNQPYKYTDIGLMVNLTVKKFKGNTSLDAAELIPVYRLKYTEKGKLIYKTVLCSEIDEYKVSNQNKVYVEETYKNIIGDFSSEVLNVE